jgi:hypothetical protein
VRWETPVFNGAGDGDRTRDIQLGKLSLRVASFCVVCENTENTGTFSLLRKCRKTRKAS